MFYLSPTNYLEGSVSVEGREPVLVQGLEAINRAVDGDSVCVQLLAREEWSSSAEVVLSDEGYDKGDSLETEKQMLSAATKSKEVVSTGRVVGIIRRKWRQYCGMLQTNPVKGSNRHIFIAAEKKIPKVEV